jgi:trigger factor
LTPVERAAIEGDVLLVDIAGFDEEGNPVDDLVGNAMSYELGTDGMLPGFDDAVRGAVKDESRRFIFTPENGDWTGVPLTVNVVVQAVRERELPALDDDFAQMASEFDTVAELRDDLAKTLRLWALSRDELHGRTRAIWAGGYRPGAQPVAEAVGSGFDTADQDSP